MDPRSTVLLAQFETSLFRFKPEDSGTPGTYRWGASVLLEFLGTIGLGLPALDSKVFQDFVFWSSKTKGLAPRSVRVAVKGSRAFLRWLAGEGQIPSVDLGTPELPEAPREHPMHLNAKGVRDYITRAEQERDPFRTILFLLPLTGQRLIELCGTPIAGVGRSGDTTVIRTRRKGSKLSFREISKFDSRECEKKLATVGLSPEANEVLRRYLRSYRKEISGSPWLFPSIYDPAEFLPTTTMRKVMVRVRDGLGLPWLTSHKAGRHTLAMMLKDRGARMEEIADALGHSSIETTRKTYAQSTAAQVASITSGAFAEKEKEG